MNAFRIVAVLLAVLTGGTPTYAQWQTQNHSVPVGRGAGVTGFDSAAPGTAEFPLVSNGPSGSPTFQRRLQPAGGGTGLDNSGASANDILSYNGAGFFRTAVIAVINAACTVAPATCTLFFGYVRPEWFGALCNGTGNDGLAFTNAQNVVSGPITVQLSGCTYRYSTPIVVLKPGVTFAGQGRQNTILDFEPTAGGASAIGIKCNGAAGELTQFTLRDFSLASNDTTFGKIGFNLVDCSQVSILRTEITKLGGGIMTGASSTICMQTNGRDLTVVEDFVFGCEFPLVLNANPNTAGNLSVDHYVFRDGYYIGSALGPCILSNQGVTITDLHFEGRQAWVRCAGGFQTNDTTSVIVGNNLTFDGVRYEQDLGAGLHPVFAINPNAGIINVVINNANMGPRGVQLRRVAGATISTSQTTCGAGNVFLDVDTSDSQVLLSNVRAGLTCTISLGGMAPAAGAIASPIGSAVPAWVMYN